MQIDHLIKKLESNNMLSHPNKTLYNHIMEIKEISSTLIKTLLSRDNKSKVREEVKELLTDVIYYHDLGKVHYLFQSCLKNSRKTNYSHSLYSFFIYLIEKYKELKEKNELGNYNLVTRYLINSLLILNHHSYLKAISSLREKLKEVDFDIIREIYDILDMSFNEEIINEAISFWKLKLKEFERYENDLLQNNIFKISIRDYLIIIFTFGIFLLADRLSAFITEDWKDEEELKTIITNLLKEIGLFSVYSQLNYEKFEEFIKKLQKNDAEINKLRTEAFKEVEKNFEKNKDKKIFKITLPTGLGKTLIGLNIALKLNQELKRPIIYSLPFLSIIEQTYGVIKNIFDGNVGKFHHLTIFNDKEDKTDIREFINFELKPITVTTFIQIFHSIFTNNRNWIIKFPFIVTSILIIDETQNLPVRCFDAFDKVLLEMTKLFGTRIILMSATQPYLLEKKEEDILESLLKDDKKNFNDVLHDLKVDLVENKEKYYCFNRYKIIVKENFLRENIKEKENKNDDFILDLEKLIEEIIKKLKEKQKVGIIVNKVDHSIKIFNKLNEKLNFQDLNNEEIEDLIKNIDLNKETLEINKIEKLENSINKFKKEKLGLDGGFSIKEEFKDLKQLIKNNIKKFYFEGKTYYLLYLSANLINLEKKLRSYLLKKLSNYNLLVISTQVIEAGIDISLDTLFRFIAPLDSIIQSAGRVNRNGFKEPIGELILIVDINKDKDKELWKHVYDKILINNTKEFLKKFVKKGINILEEKDITKPEKIENYFKEVRKSKDDKPCVRCKNNNNFVEDTIKKLDFGCIGKFSLIENGVLQNLILDLDYIILKNFNEIYQKTSKIEDRNEKMSILKEIKNYKKIEEFFKASRFGKLSKEEENAEKILKEFLENNKIVTVLNEKKEIKKEFFSFYSIGFVKENEIYYKTKKTNDFVFYNYFGFEFKISDKKQIEKLKKELQNIVEKWEEDQIENFIDD